MSVFRIQSEVFLKRDIENILRAIDRTNAALAANLPLAEVAIYRAGFSSAMEAVAAAFDVALTPDLQESLADSTLRLPSAHR